MCRWQAGLGKEDAWPAPPGPPPRYVTQDQDHFDNTNNRTWQQAYYVNDTYWVPGSDAPIFSAPPSPSRCVLPTPCLLASPSPPCLRGAGGGSRPLPAVTRPRRHDTLPAPLCPPAPAPARPAPTPLPLPL